MKEITSNSNLLGYKTLPGRMFVVKRFKIILQRVAIALTRTCGMWFFIEMLVTLKIHPLNGTFSHSSHVLGLVKQ